MTRKERHKIVAKRARVRSLFQSEQRRCERVREANASLRKENAELCEANANLRVERDATDHLLGIVIDDLLGGEGVLV
jgi:hypothetical protein